VRMRPVVAALATFAVLVGIGTNVADSRLLPWGVRGVSGSIGEDVDVHPYQLHVNGVTVAETVVQTSPISGDVTEIDSDGIWVVVDMSYATVDTERAPGTTDLVLRDGQGREYRVSDRSDGKAWLVGPDIWLRGTLAFEVAPDSLTGLVMVFDPQGKLYGPMPVDYAVIPLEVDDVAIQPSAEIVAPQILDEGDR
jgi:hypothetical protein